MIKDDCYWMEKILDMGATIHICTRHDEPKYDPECEDCDDYISDCTVHKMVRSIADLLIADLGLHLAEVENEW